MSNDTEQEFLCDGITEEIITALSKVPNLLVIARNPTFTYKGKPVKIQDVSKELNVRYVLEGSVRKADDRVRITAQLIDVEGEHHLWAERYDRELRDIFALQDEITMKVISELPIVQETQKHSYRAARSTSNLEAYLTLMQANYHIYKLNPKDNIRAKQL